MAKRAISPHPANFTRHDLEMAAQDVREMILDSSVLQNLTANLIVARRLYMVIRSALDNEIHRGWEAANPDLIIQTLVFSAQEKANEKFKIADLQAAVFTTVVPLLDIILQQVQETGQDIDGTEDFQDAGEKEEPNESDSNAEPAGNTEPDSG